MYAVRLSAKYSFYPRTLPLPRRLLLHYPHKAEKVHRPRLFPLPCLVHLFPSWHSGYFCNDSKRQPRPPPSRSVSTTACEFIDAWCDPIPTKEGMRLAAFSREKGLRTRSPFTTTTPLPLMAPPFFLVFSFSDPCLLSPSLSVVLA